MRALFLASALALLSLLTAGIQASSQSSTQSGDEHPKLPAGEGRDLMIRVCSQCHVPDQAADEQLDAAGWKDLVDQMAAKGATATENEFEQIVRYLANAFPVSK